MIQHWVTEKYTSHQYFGIGGFGDIETFVSDPLEVELAVTEEAEVFTGGWTFAYEQEVAKRKKKHKELERLEAKAQKIQDKVDRELALELQKDERDRERVNELERLASLAQQHEDSVLQLGERVEKAYNRAILNHTYSANEALERVIRQAHEEEKWLINITMELLQ